MSDVITILGGRQSGKTTELIRQCVKHGGYIVCRSHAEATRIVREAEGMGHHIAFPITYREFVLREFHAAHCSPIWIDDVGEMLNWMTSATIGGFTVETSDQSIRFGGGDDE